MTKRWKLKTNSSNILLVLITLILVKAEWVKEDDDKYWESTNAVGIVGHENQIGHTHTYVGNNQIAEYYFHSSSSNDSFILEGINKCLDSFQLTTCVKMLLLNRVNEVLSLMEELNVSQKDISLLNGVFVFKIKNEKNDTEGSSEKNDSLNLDEEISVKLKKIFQDRYLMINVLPRVKIEIEPSKQQGDDFVCFRYKIRKEFESENSSQDTFHEGRKKKGGGMSMMMMVPQLIMLGLMPFTLASLKAMVMNAVMINMMALNGAIFMTIRNLVFGPRQGDNVKYVNYGYSKNRQTQSPKPVLIIHSPAAFVKQPPIHKKQVHEHSSHPSTMDYFPQSHYSKVGSISYPHNTEKIIDYADDYYYIPQGESSHNRRQQEIQNGNKQEWINTYDKIDAIRELKVQNKKLNQRKLEEMRERRRNTPSKAKTLEGSNHERSTNYEYLNVDEKLKQPAKKSPGHRREPGKENFQLKPSPQWDARF